MSIRWRASGELLCGANSAPMPDDTYIDDRLHYELSVVMGVVVADEDHERNHLWHWNEEIVEKYRPAWESAS